MARPGTRRPVKAASARPFPRSRRARATPRRTVTHDISDSGLAAALF